MMLPTLKITEKHALLFGMYWVLLDSLDSRHEKITELRSNGAHFCATFKSRSGDENIGTADGYTAVAKSVTLLSGAAQFAVMPEYQGKTALALFEANGDSGNENLVAVVGLVNGNIVIDKLLPASHVPDEIARFGEMCERAHQTAITVGSILTEGLAQISAAVTWEDLLPQQISRFKQTKAVPVKPLRSERTAQIAGFAIIGIVVLVAGFQGWEKYQQGQKRKRAAEAARKVNPEVLYAASVKQFLEVPKPLLRDALQTIRQAVGGIDTQFAGWQLLGAACVVDSCTLQWERSGGTFAEFADRAPKAWKNIRFENDGTHASAILPISVQPRILPEPSKWMSMDVFKLTEVSRWQRFTEVSFQFALSNPTLEAVPPGVSPALLESSPNAIRAATWKTSGDWYMSRGFDTSSDYITFEKLNLVVNPTGVVYEATGKVYVKS